MTGICAAYLLRRACRHPLCTRSLVPNIGPWLRALLVWRPTREPEKAANGGFRAPDTISSTFPFGTFGRANRRKPRRIPPIFPFSGDFCRGLGSIRDCRLRAAVTKSNMRGLYQEFDPSRSTGKRGRGLGAAGGGRRLAWPWLLLLADRADAGVLVRANHIIFTTPERAS